MSTQILRQHLIPTGPKDRVGRLTRWRARVLDARCGDLCILSDGSRLYMVRGRIMHLVARNHAAAARADGGC